MTNYKVITKDDIGIDHRFVRMTLCMSERLARLKTFLEKSKTFQY